MIALQKPPFGFVLVFLLFSLMYLSNTFKLWFKTDAYYQDIHESLTRMPALFRDLFISRFENRKRWEVEQKIFSLIGFVAVVIADVWVIRAWLGA